MRKRTLAAWVAACLALAGAACFFVLAHLGSEDPGELLYRRMVKAGVFAEGAPHITPKQVAAVADVSPSLRRWLLAAVTSPKMETSVRMEAYAVLNSLSDGRQLKQVMLDLLAWIESSPPKTYAGDVVQLEVRRGLVLTVLQSELSDADSIAIIRRADPPPGWKGILEGMAAAVEASPGRPVSTADREWREPMEKRARALLQYVEKEDARG